MFRVLVVDDEPSAVEYICNIIRLKCPELQVVATAEDGQQGLEAFTRLKPDLVISDVKMPVMSGLDMVKQIKEMDKGAGVLLVSGYQEFEYVKAALKYGVSDYVLKPMTPANFLSSVTPVLRELNEKVYNQRKMLVRAMILGENQETEQIRAYFPEETYFLAVVREKGLPRRFTGAPEIELISEAENTMFVYGRDEREALYICPSKAVSGPGFYRLVEKEAEKKNCENSFVTAVVIDHPIPAGELSQSVSRLYKELNSRLSIGNTRIFSVGAGKELAPGEVYEAETLKSMERSMEKKDYSAFLEQLKAFIERAGQAGYPQLKLERFVRQTASELMGMLDWQDNVFEDEMMFEDAFYEAGNGAELCDSLSSIFKRYWKDDKEAVRVDSPEFLETVKSYLKRHLAEEITVSSVCREFGLSQSYLNLIFRKYGMQSFQTYLRTARIEHAKQVMERNPQMFIKDVAMMAGYRDQFYFSRIFRAVTGVSPTEYIDRLS